MLKRKYTSDWWSENKRFKVPPSSGRPIIDAAYPKYLPHRGLVEAALEGKLHDYKPGSIPENGLHLLEAMKARVGSNLKIIQVRSLYNMYNELKKNEKKEHPDDLGFFYTIEGHQMAGWIHHSKGETKISFFDPSGDYDRFIREAPKKVADIVTPLGKNRERCQDNNSDTCTAWSVAKLMEQMDPSFGKVGEVLEILPEFYERDDNGVWTGPTDDTPVLLANEEKLLDFFARNFIPSKTEDDLSESLTKIGLGGMMRRRRNKRPMF